MQRRYLPFSVSNMLVEVGVCLANLVVRCLSLAGYLYLFHLHLLLLCAEVGLDLSFDVFVVFSVSALATFVCLTADLGLSPQEVRPISKGPPWERRHQGQWWSP